MPECIVFACSPRKNGNTDLAAQAICKKMDAALTDWCLVQLRDYHVLPCTGCGACETTGECVLGKKDQTLELFSLLRKSRRAVFLSPIYFYHVPAQFKAFIDRAQVFYWARQADLARPLQKEKLAWLGLWGGRRQGENLFCGAERSIRFFLRVLGFELQPSLSFYGVDKAGDIFSSAERLEQLENFGKQIWFG